MVTSFDEQLKTYNEKKEDHLQHWKKIQALKHFAMAHPHKKIWEEIQLAIHVVELAIRFHDQGFLWLSWETLLNDLLAHYGIDYLSWAVKDAWVKQQLINGFKQPWQAFQMEFFFEDLDKIRIEAREKMPIYSKLARHVQLPLRAT